MGKKRRTRETTGRTEIIVRTRTGKKKRIRNETKRKRKPIARYSVTFKIIFLSMKLFTIIFIVEAQQRLIELEAEKQRLDDELSRAQKKISVSEKAVASLTDVQSVTYLIYYYYNQFQFNFHT